MSNKSIWLVIAIACPIIYWGCNRTSNVESGRGTFGYDYHFLNRHVSPVILSDKDSSSMIIIAPEYQGRVMTSTADGMDGYSFGWINYELIQSDEINPQFNPYGGEERLWLGPEGGQYALFFKNGESFDFVNWKTPPFIDTEPFNISRQTDSSVIFTKDAQFQNYSGYQFSISITRGVKLLQSAQILRQLDMKDPKVAMVGYQSVNIVENSGNKPWSKDSGLLSIWMLGMFHPSPEATMILPYRTGSEDSLGYIVNDNYFGSIPDKRLMVDNGIIYFKADGKQRGKIGISAQRVKPFAASYDPVNNVLTVLEVELPSEPTNNYYVNSSWEIQEEPFRGDVINAYNDGPLEDGSQLGPFYELESSSPAKELNPGESIKHVQRTYHFVGNEETLSAITKKLFGIELLQD